MGYLKMLEKLGNIGEQIKKSPILFDDIKEILINSNCRVSVFYKNNKTFIGDDIISQNQIQDIFASLCEYSVHTYHDEILRGFITVSGGIRIGICGTAIYENGSIIGIKEISALNIRIPHEFIGISDKIYPLFNHCGILIIGPPCSGKTTMLRDLARKLSSEYKTTIIDERFEIAGMIKGKPSFNISSASVLSGFYKKDGMSFAVRSMSPEIMICDEFGGIDDIESSMFAMKSGCSIIASMHAFDIEDFVSKSICKNVINSGIFKHFVFMDRSCNITRILSREEIMN